MKRIINNMNFPSKKQLLLTKKGLDDLKARLNRLHKERAAMCKRLLKMDKREREEYILSTNAITMLEKNEEEINKVSDILMNADVVADEKRRSDVGVGSVVSLQYLDTTKKYTIVSSIEANPSENMISENSPLGKALIGKKIRSRISLSGRDGRHYNYKVLDVA